jgi:type I restriction enzyme R subunit
MTAFTESEIEDFCLRGLTDLGFAYTAGPDIAPDSEPPLTSYLKEEKASYGPDKRKSYSDVLLLDILRDAVKRLNPQISEKARDEAIKQVRSIYSPQLIDANESFHRMLTEGVSVTVNKDGAERGEKVWLVDFQKPENNSFYAINQFTVAEKNQHKRPDIVLFVNGLPLVVIELKNPGDAQATVRKAYDQIQVYKSIIPQLFFYNAICVISDGLEARTGTISSQMSRFTAWKTADGVNEAPVLTGQIEVLLKGMLNKKTLIDLIQNFIVFEKDKKIDAKTGLTQIENVKKIAAYHQYYAVNKAVESTKKASKADGSRKAGVVWHTQGSGKSLSMVFYAGKLIKELDNPTIVVITDRNDLDDQLFDTFAASTQLLRQPPVQAESRDNLKTLLKVASGGIVFTTIHKFFPDKDSESYELLSDRKNIIVIADEAHRTQYGFTAKMLDVKDAEGNLTGKKIGYGFAKHMRDAIPNATFIGFTGTPVESTDINTPRVFGNYIDIYDIARSVEDGATVKIIYESRLAKVNLTKDGRRLIEEYEKDMEEDGATDSQQVKLKWTKLEAIVGHPERLKNLAKDLVEHYEARSDKFKGKGMIVAMSRRIAVALYDEIIKIRPEWHSMDRTKGAIKVVMTSSSSDKLEYDPEDPDSLVIPSYHRTTKDDRRVLSDRLKDPDDPLKLVIVRDMWLTGFDVPCLHTMYIDKIMKGHTLMQAIARVNRVFLDKEGGLIVDYIGIGNALKEAVAFYSNAGGKGDPVETQEKALKMLLEKIEVVRQMFHGLGLERFHSASTAEKLSLILEAEEFILKQTQGKERFIKEATILSRVFVLAVPHEDALALKDEIALYQAIRARLLKFEANDEASGKNYESAIRQIVIQAVESNEVIDIFDAAGIKKPEISLLSPEFLLEVQNMKHKNLAFELLKKILNDEINVRTKYNITEGKKLLEMLERAIAKYQNNLLTTAEIIEELIAIAKGVGEMDSLPDKLNLSKEEVAFYGALEANDSAVKVLGDETLRDIAREIAEKVRNNATIDWTMKESARAKLMVLVKRTLNKYGYPPDKQQKAIETVLKQAEVMADYWVKA